MRLAALFKVALRRSRFKAPVGAVQSRFATFKVQGACRRCVKSRRDEIRVASRFNGWYMEVVISCGVP